MRPGPEGATGLALRAGASSARAKRLPLANGAPAGVPDPGPERVTSVEAFRSLKRHSLS